MPHNSLVSEETQARGHTAMATPFYWNELNTYDFDELSADTTIAILPIASTEQHGPHLPIATDVAIANGMLAELRRQRPDDLDILVLPTQEIGKANEHIYGPGTLSLSAELLIPYLDSTRRQSCRSRGPQNGDRQFARWQCRHHEHRRARAACTLPDGGRLDPVGPFRTSGRHDQRPRIPIRHPRRRIETSLMLHFRPDLVRMDKAQNFAIQG